MGRMKRFIYTQWLPNSPYSASSTFGDFELHNEMSMGKARDKALCDNRRKRVYKTVKIIRYISTLKHYCIANYTVFISPIADVYPLMQSQNYQNITNAYPALDNMQEVIVF